MSELVVWYDGGCPLCRREIALMRRLDTAHAIRFEDVSTGAACPIDRATLLGRFHAREDGHIVSGAAAFAAMWRAIPRLRPLGLAARNAHVLAVLEALYRGFLRIRPRLQWALRRLERESAVSALQASPGVAAGINWDKAGDAARRQRRRSPPAILDPDPDARRSDFAAGTQEQPVQPNQGTSSW